ncbi:hypothetical protein [Borrelia miyamotoi]|uniref:Uncharacterized protein n=2 Tax=Borrelia miyamotoi TaxID=47466 RepID=A0AAQ2WXD3_9SPIR|nr:hypothetical protein [Borrelia miyamotoi]WAZ91376.1 hypothetical protein O5398_04355 [Borrelia miyamotoi]WAZ92662.1 hypothetical protein O5402_04355 [Borrelia miyamotoi]WAZ93953.1 hypothetical protein O5399_04360 [Borrelia miyamotoi]WAZ95244.1 hypothetical protein O5397_04350 [Borrelia miyamotoi]WAZ96529.1 hypothetical protein O5405_04350 [Borrelia miyamotoi]
MNLFKLALIEILPMTYHKNELNHKNIEYLKENFDIKLEKVEARVKSNIASIKKPKINNRIDIVKMN